MRSFVVMLVLCTALTAGARPIVVPGEHTYLDEIVPGSPPDTSWVTETLNSIQDGVDLAIMLTYEHPLAGNGYPGFSDTVLVMPGRYDSVLSYYTPVGWRSAIVSISRNVVLIGEDRSDVEIDFTQADYGILCQGVNDSTLISELTIDGGASKDRGPADDGDGRLLAAGICCLDAASPVISKVDIEGGSTGIVVRTQPGSEPSAPSIRQVVVARGSHHGIYVYENGPEPVSIYRCTLVDNFDYGVYVSGGNAEINSCAITHNGKNGVYGYLAVPSVTYSNLFLNDQIFPDQIEGPQNYGGTLDDLTEVDGNISKEPYYCDYFGSSGYDYHVCVSDPPSPHIGAGEGGVMIGAYNATCSGCGETPVQHSSWGAIKAMYGD